VTCSLLRGHGPASHSNRPRIHIPPEELDDPILRRCCSHPRAPGGCSPSCPITERRWTVLCKRVELVEPADRIAPVESAGLVLWVLRSVNGSDESSLRRVQSKTPSKGWTLFPPQPSPQLGRRIEVKGGTSWVSLHGDGGAFGALGHGLYVISAATSAEDLISASYQ
jgi:hypothetical protein